MSIFTTNAIGLTLKIPLDCIHQMVIPIIMWYVLYSIIQQSRTKYISNVLIGYKPNKSLKSLGLSRIKICKVHSKHAETALSYYATHSWNQLPENIRGPAAYPHLSPGWTHECKICQFTLSFKTCGW